MDRVVLIQGLPINSSIEQRRYKVTRMMRDENSTQIIREYILDNDKMAIALNNKLFDQGYKRVQTNIGAVFSRKASQKF